MGFLAALAYLDRASRGRMDKLIGNYKLYKGEISLLAMKNVTIPVAKLDAYAILSALQLNFLEVQQCNPSWIRGNGTLA